MPTSAQDPSCASVGRTSAGPGGRQHREQQDAGHARSAGRRRAAEGRSRPSRGSRGRSSPRRRRRCPARARRCHAAGAGPRRPARVVAPAVRVRAGPALTPGARRARVSRRERCAAGAGAAVERTRTPAASTRSAVGGTGRRRRAPAESTAATISPSTSATRTSPAGRARESSAASRRSAGGVGGAALRMVMSDGGWRSTVRGGHVRVIAPDVASEQMNIVPHWYKFG